MTPRGIAVGMVYAPVVLLSARARSTQLVVAVTLLCSVLIVLGYFISVPGMEGPVVVVNRGLTLLLTWIIAGLVVQRVQAGIEREGALAQLKVLNGLIAVCSSCKKIRDDDGAWQPMESYIAQHSEADFTHSICPHCTEELYGLTVGDLKAGGAESSSSSSSVRPWRLPAYLPAKGTVDDGR